MNIEVWMKTNANYNFFKIMKCFFFLFCQNGKRKKSRANAGKVYENIMNNEIKKNKKLYKSYLTDLKWQKQGALEVKILCILKSLILTLLNMWNGITCYWSSDDGVLNANILKKLLNSQQKAFSDFSVTFAFKVFFFKCWVLKEHFVLNVSVDVNVKAWYLSPEIMPDSI